MLDSLLRFSRGILAMSGPWQLWLALLGLVNMVVPLFLLDLPEARATLAAFLIAAALMTVLTHRFGFARILGLGHIVPWVPLLAYLIPRLGNLPAATAPGVWLRVLVVVNAISLVIDVVDVVRWLRGERAETVPLPV